MKTMIKARVNIARVALWYLLMRGVVIVIDNTMPFETATPFEQLVIFFLAIIAVSTSVSMLIRYDKAYGEEDNED